MNFFFALLSFFYVSVPVVNMRELPSDSSEVTSQAYFSEEVHVLEEKSNWVKIETIVDHYQGWIKKKSLYKCKEKFPQSSAKVAIVDRSMAHLYHLPDTIYGPILTLPFNSLLEVVDEEDSKCRWIKVRLVNKQELFIQRGDITFNMDIITRDELLSFSLRFLGLPYTWGGRSSFGYDCSGFVQMLYRQMGIYIPRDSKDQAKWEKFKDISFDKLLPGDLVFFGLEKDKIRHVGMYLGQDQFINATAQENAPYIHISHLSDPEWSGLGKWPYRTARTFCDKIDQQ